MQAIIYFMTHTTGLGRQDSGSGLQELIGELEAETRGAVGAHVSDRVA